MTLLEKISHVAAAAHAPFVVRRQPEAVRPGQLHRAGERRATWPRSSTASSTPSGSRSASREDSRYVGADAAARPRASALRPGNVPVEAFNFEEDVDGTDHDKYLWMNAAWAFGTRITDAFAKYGWMRRHPRRRRRRQGRGPAGPHLPDRRRRRRDEVPDRDRHHRPSRVRAVDNLGFIPLWCTTRDRLRRLHGRAVVPEAEEVRHRRANANAELSAKFNLHPLHVAVRALPEGDGARQDRLVHGAQRL